jgi:hypothetical protein
MRISNVLKLFMLMGVLLAMSCSNGTTPARGDSHAAALLPQAPPQWSESGETKVFTGVALSDYINGGAEAYLAYGFREVAARDFENASGARLTVEIYAMDRPENAFGIYSTDPTGTRLPIGADASYGSGLLRFWKSKFFVRIVCYPADENIEKIITDTGNKIADAIVGESRRPELFLSLVPEAGVDQDSICYFHRQTSLNNIRYLTDENLLHLGDDVDAITWEERVGASSADTLRQIVLRYPTDAEAEAAQVDFSRKYFGPASGASSSAAPPLPNGKYATAGRRASWVIVVLDAPSYELASMAFKRTLATLNMAGRSEG